MQKLGDMLKTAIVVAALVPLPAQAASYKCPASDASKDSSKLNLSPAEIPGLEPKINQPLRSAIERMKTEGMKSGDIVDKLIVSYCGRLDQDSKLSGNEKAEQVRRFASNLAGVVYSGTASNEEDVLVDVPVPASLFGKLQRAAETANVSQDAWIDQAIQRRLANP